MVRPLGVDQYAKLVELLQKQRFTLGTELLSAAVHPFGERE
jgi:hypothetical protein